MKKTKILNFSLRRAPFSYAAILSIALIAVLSFSGCAPPLVSDFVFAGITQSREDSIAGFQGTLFLDTAEDGLTPVGETSEKQIVIENSGETDIVIHGLNIFLHSFDNTGNFSGAAAEQNIFSLRDGTRPDLPLAVKPGDRFGGIYVVFKPQTCGLAVGSLTIETNQGSKTLRIAGKGCWNLTLRTNSAQGKIISPIITSNSDVVYRSMASEVLLEAQTAHPLGLIELDNWVVDTPGTAVINDEKAIATSVLLSNHTTITAGFYDPYFRVAPIGGDYTTIEAALTAYIPGDTGQNKKGIVVAAGTYTPAGNLTLKKGIIRGGYNTDFDAREYETVEDRENADYRTVINLGVNYIIAGGTTAATSLDETSLFEGFTVTGGTASQSILIGDGCEAAFRYNTITAPLNNYAIRSDNSSPVVAGNVITGANASDQSAITIFFNKSDGALTDNVITAGNGPLRSVPVHIFDESDPVISDNTITAGNTTSAGGESCGIYVDWFSNPVLSGNTITAGTSSGDGGKSTGVFLINSSSPIIRNNIVDGGTGGAEAFVIYHGGYGGWPIITGNALFTSGGTRRYGMYVGPNGRIETLSNNNFYLVTDGFVKLYSYAGTEILNTIEKVNDKYLPKDAAAEDLNRSVAP